MLYVSSGPYHWPNPEVQCSPRFHWSGWAPSPQHHSRSDPLEICYIIVENNSFKAVGQLNNTLGWMQSPCCLTEHLQWGYDFLLRSYCWILQQLNSSFTPRVNYQWFTVSAQSLTAKLCGCVGPDQTNCTEFLLMGEFLLLTSEMAAGVIRVCGAWRGGWRYSLMLILCSCTSHLSGRIFGPFWA